MSAFFAGAAVAQQNVPNTGAPPPGMGNPKREAIERQGREAMLRGAEMLSRPSGDQRGVRGAAEQLKQDFKRIQILRNNLARHLTSDDPLDYKVIADTAGELNKRANRLGTLLMPQTSGEHDAKPHSQIELDGALMQSALVTLCRRIDSFTGNPIFKVLDVVDVEQASKAGEDLRGIIRLSARVKEGAERMNKTARR
ncbi:MAG TPA: hypothetical protein VF297_00025 [Pyrinomonadaceae bacterium]